jgi:hypothetical protein
MNRAHVIVIALVLGLAAVFGLVAAARTTHLAGGGQAHASAAAITARSRQLDRTEAALRRALRDRPPAIPPAHAPAQRVIVHRPAPLIVVTHHAGGEHEAEHEAEAEHQDD